MTEAAAAVYVDPNTLTPWDKNPRNNAEAIKQVAKSIERFGFASPIVARQADGRIIAGHTRHAAALKLGLEDVPVRFLDIDEQKASALALADNKIGEIATWNDDTLGEILAELEQDGFDLDGLGWDKSSLDEILGESSGGVDPLSDGRLSRDFIWPPFTVLNARDGEWQKRKRIWIDYQICSHLGRADNLTYSSPLVTIDSLPGEDGYTSIFDPVLAELVYSWFSPSGSAVLDPFAGGSVRGIVAAMTGRNYTGVDLRAEQVEANEKQWDSLKDGLSQEATGSAQWIQGDSRIDLPAGVFDLLFSCPPYANLEVYSSNEADLSNMDYETFLTAYRDIINESCLRLNMDRFACFVVGDIRDGSGNYRNFVSHTVQAFINSGLELYNSAVLVTQVGTVAMTAARPFRATRKLGKTHQNVLVFVKGDARKAAQYCGTVKEWEGIDRAIGGEDGTTD